MLNGSQNNDHRLFILLKLSLPIINFTLKTSRSSLTYILLITDIYKPSLHSPEHTFASKRG